MTSPRNKAAPVIPILQPTPYFIRVALIYKSRITNYELRMSIPFQPIDWSLIAREEHRGETGIAYWQTLQFPGLRIRLVEYSQGYKADHWCEKGHVVHCLEGSFTSKLKTGEEVVLSSGMSYVVSDRMSSHLSITGDGVKLLIVDGDFLGT